MPDVLVQELAALSTILQQTLVAIQKSTASTPETADKRERFWATYEHAVSEYNEAYLRKYYGTMNSCMIFASMIAIVSAVFAVIMQPHLSSNVAMQAFLDVVVLSPNGPLPGGPGPSANVFWSQSLLYASLSCCLFAAFWAAIGKQWLDHYDSSEERGSLETRGKAKQRKLAALETLYLRVVLDALPVLLQSSLFFFGLALSIHIWSAQRIVAIILIVTIGLGVLCYLAIVVFFLRHSDCPFVTPRHWTTMSPFGTILLDSHV